MSEQLINFYNTCPEWQLWYVITRLTIEIQQMTADWMKTFDTSLQTEITRLTALRDRGILHIVRFHVTDYAKWCDQWSHWWDHECTQDEWAKCRQEAIENGIGCFFF